jgi:hypothetical protein
MHYGKRLVSMNTQIHKESELLSLAFRTARLHAVLELQTPLQSGEHLHAVLELQTPLQSGARLHAVLELQTPHAIGECKKQYSEQELCLQEYNLTFYKKNAAWLL